MKFIIVFACLIALALASPEPKPEPEPEPEPQYVAYPAYTHAGVYPYGHYRARRQVYSTFGYAGYAYPYAHFRARRQVYTPVAYSGYYPYAHYY